MGSRQIIFITLVLLIGASISCKKEDDWASNPNAASQKLSELGGVMQISFPAGATLINYQCDQGWLDDMIEMKVRVPGSKLGSFLDSAGFNGGKVTTNENASIPFQMTDNHQSWWDIETVSKWKASCIALPKAKYLIILVDIGSKDKYTVYIVWFET